MPCVFIFDYIFVLTEITINYRHGLPLVTLTLPSRKERCQFVVKPMLSTVGSFLQDLQNEDKGIKAAAVVTTGVCLCFVDLYLQLARSSLPWACLVLYSPKKGSVVT